MRVSSDMKSIVYIYNFIRRHHDYVILYLFVHYVHLTNGPKRSLDGIGYFQTANDPTPIRYRQRVMLHAPVDTYKY